MIYLDYQATTPLAPEAAEAMRPWLDKFANPHAPSRWGREAAAAVEVARGQVEAAIGLEGGSLAFTGSATEALNWALKGTVENSDGNRNRIVTAQTEHAAVLDTCAWLEGRGIEVTYLPVNLDGVVDSRDLAAAVDERTLLVAIMQVNNEIGVLQDIGGLARTAHAKGALFLCDAVQAFGRMRIAEGPDLVAVSAHKIHGPKGIGALWMRAGAEPAPLIHGGGQERGLRSGTLSPALCAGFGAAAAVARQRMQDDERHVQRLYAKAAKIFAAGGWHVNGSTRQRYWGNLNIRRDGVDASRLLADLREIAFSLGSACASGSGRPSHVLRALGLSDREARSSVRIGFGRYTSEEELLTACRRIDEAARAQANLAA